MGIQRCSLPYLGQSIVGDSFDEMNMINSAKRIGLGSQCLPGETSASRSLGQPVPAQPVLGAANAWGSQSLPGAASVYLGIHAGLFLSSFDGVQGGQGRARRKGSRTRER